MGGGDKCLLTIAGETLLGRAIARARVQTAALALSINGDPARFEAYDVPVVKDVVPGHAGPLAGILSGMRLSECNSASLLWRHCSRPWANRAKMRSAKRQRTCGAG